MYILCLTHSARLRGVQERPKVRRGDREMFTCCPVEVSHTLLLRLNVTLGKGAHCLQVRLSIRQQARRFDAFELIGVVGHQSDAFDPEEFENGIRIVVTTGIVRQAKRPVGIHRVITLVLHVIGLDLVGETNPTSFLSKVDDHASSGLLDPLKRSLELLPTIATLGPKDLTRHAGGVKPTEDRFASSHVTVS